MKKIRLSAVIIVLCVLLAGCEKNEIIEINNVTEEPAPTVTATPFVTETPMATHEVMVPGKTDEPIQTRKPVILPSVTESPTPQAKPTATPTEEKSNVYLNDAWEFAEFSEINSGYAVLYRAQKNRKNIVIGVNAGHGTNGGTSKKTYCHPDKTPKLTSGTTAAGSVKAVAVSGGMTFSDGTPEKKVTLRTAQILRDLLLEDGYDVLMLRDGDDVQLDNVARTVICNNVADCHIAIHFDGDGLKYDKGCFYLAAPEGLKKMYPVSETWQKSHALGDSIIEGLSDKGNKIFNKGTTKQDLTQTSYSKVPSVNIELGNQSSKHDDESLLKIAQGLKAGIDKYFS